jgi:hypothetical protein
MLECKMGKGFQSAIANRIPVKKRAEFFLTNQIKGYPLKKYEIGRTKASYHRLQLITL